MGRLPRHHRKRKTGKGGGDSSGEERRRSESWSPERKSKRVEKAKPREKSPATPSSNKNEESLSIDETNKLRASLGLAPLEVEEAGSKEGQLEGGDGSGKIYKEDGMEFVHKKAEHLGEKKRAEEMREKLQALRDKRRLYDKVLKGKGLVDSDSEGEDAANWVAKNRRLEEERKRAEERAKILDEMDADFGVNALLNEEKKTKQVKRVMKEKKSDLAGLVVGHAKEDFLEGNETVLVLEDKGVLDDGEEVLINPNLVENQRHQRNVELRKRKDRYEPYKEALDDFGIPKEKGVLSKYDEELEGEVKRSFRLGDGGEVDIDKEHEEMEMRRKLFMMNKKLESLETPKYTVASEFYTQEEMLSFRRPKSKKEKKLRKRKEKMLKADDLVPDEAALADDAERAAKSAGHRQEVTVGLFKEEKKVTKDIQNLEDGELAEDERKSNWRAATTSEYVDVNSLSKSVEMVEDDEEEDGLILLLL